MCNIEAVSGSGAGTSRTTKALKLKQSKVELEVVSQGVHKC
jgi:hypothetical protein